ncbi:MAG: porphobilinogen synthase [Chloroflexi bacterium]|nr:porphobilinogen synthase [Chloroflexota bacterium]
MTELELKIEPREKARTLGLRARPRRLRLSSAIRRMVRETELKPDDFIYPLFVRYGSDQRLPIHSMPGQSQLTVDKLAAEAREVASLGIPGVILFGIPQYKDWRGSDNFSDDGVIPRAIRAIKEAAPDLAVISDMCLCEYTDHGHCGIVNAPEVPHFDPALPLGYLLNDPTLDLLGRASVAHARAGADIIAPSGMIDGMVAGIRSALDSEGFSQVAVMSYAAKYASVFYGPFRDAAHSAPGFGDRKQYQLDPANRREALKEIALDVEQGADILLVKPALPSLDIVNEARRQFDLPLAAYQVSGEYAMIHSAARAGWLDLEQSALESLTCIKRAGADLIVTYFAKDAIKWLADG